MRKSLKKKSVISIISLLLIAMYLLMKLTLYLRMAW